MPKLTNKTSVTIQLQAPRELHAQLVYLGSVQGYSRDETYQEMVKFTTTHPDFIKHLSGLDYLHEQNERDEN